MRVCLSLLGILLLDAAPADTQAAIREAAREVAQFAEAGDFDAARARLDDQEAAIAAIGEAGWGARIQGRVPASNEERALLTHARGVLEMQAGELAAAVEHLGSARAQAGPGVIRLDSTYDLGVLHLVEGERFRAVIPELSGGAPAPAPPGPDGEEAPDPLEAARANYLMAREWFVERLILDWRDEDTRANTELVQRRLRELDEIERQREEREAEEPQDSQEPQEGDGDGEESSDEEQDPGEDSAESAEGEREPQDPGDGEQPPAEEAEDAEDAEPEEVHLTEEEMQRLLEALREIEEEGEAVQEALRRIGRQNVDRDW